MQFAMTDILSVALIGLIAVAFLVRLFFKMRKNKCITVCSGCQGNSCSTKNFAKLQNNTQKSIEIFKS